MGVCRHTAERRAQRGHFIHAGMENSRLFFVLWACSVGLLNTFARRLRPPDGLVRQREGTVGRVC